MWWRTYLRTRLRKILQNVLATVRFQGGAVARGVSGREEKFWLQEFLLFARAEFCLAQRLGFASAVALVEFEEAGFMRAHAAQRTFLPVLERLVAIAHPVLAALGLQEHRDLGQHVFYLGPHHRHHPPDLPLRA